MSDRKSVRVLYIEDDQGAARLFQKKLERLGYAVDLAYDGESGLATYNPDRHDLIALDQRMPGHGGLDVIRLLAERGPLPPIIMITGAGDEQIAVQAMKLGAADYIVKDVDAGYLELVPSVIDQLLRQQRLANERREALEALERSNSNLALLNHLGQALTAMLNTRQIFRELLRAATDIVGAQSSSVWLQSEKTGGPLSCKGVFRRGKYRDDTDFSLRAKQGLVGCVAQKMKSMIADNPVNSDRYPELQVYQGKVSSLVAVPLSARGALVGVLQVANKVHNAFDANDSRLLETLAASAGIALDNARLVDALRHQTEELRAQNEDLDAFAHTVAHDLKSPVGMIIWLNYFLMEEASEKLSEEERMYVNQTHAIIQKMNNIIDELLLLAEVRTGDVQLQPLDMAAIIAEARMRLMNLIEEHKPEIVTPETWPDVLGYSPWVEEVWINYISNAIKYGGQPPRVELGATPLQDGRVRLWVKDNGAGLSPEQCAQLFTPFTRLQQVSSKGHGLGLSIVRRIVEKLGGKVDVESEIGRGSTFGFTLPCSKM